MTAIEAYALAKKAAHSDASSMVSSSKITKVEFTESKLIISLGDETMYEVEIPLAHTVTGAEIKDGHLIFQLEDGEEIDAGALPSGGSIEWGKFNGEE